MVIKSLKLKNYRNYDLLDLKFDPKTNILYGDNAQGKTNILEALYLSGTTKSHRGTKDRDVIQFGYDESHIETIIEKRNIDFQIDMHLKKNSPKGIAIDKVPIRRAGELFGIVHFVFFSPEDLNITTRLNGQVVQQGRTEQLITGVRALISFITASMTLEPGDVIATGTPAGVGPMQPGDTVEVEVSGIGILCNTIV